MSRHVSVCKVILTIVGMWYNLSKYVVYGEGERYMPSQSDSGTVLMKYDDTVKRVTITVKEVQSGGETRYQVKWTSKVGADYEVDFMECRTLEEARASFILYIRTYVLNENSE